MAVLGRIASLVLTLAITFVGLTAVTFLISRLTNIDPVLAVTGDRVGAATYDAVYKELGLDQPVFVQYGIYLKRLVSGDFGVSVLTSRPVLSDLLRVFPATFELATIAIIIGVVLGIPMGVVAAAAKGRWPDQVIRVVGLLGYSVPIFWLGLVGLFLFYGKLGWVAGTGRLDVFYQGVLEHRTGVILIDAALEGNWEIFSNAFSHLILPASLLGYFSLAYIARMTRSFMIDQLSQEYVIAARIKGNSYWGAVWRHAFPNIMVPLITVIGLSYASLLEGAVLTETVFAWPGLGLYITRALFNSDMNAVLGGTVLVGAVFITINVVSDMLYKLFDPRLRRS
ncbi:MULTISPECIES: ABC transporter permease [unclassified Devosia]|uniref:ABC transporter permease n=1 Tax=unclassified Devosia TaxID=196773 RepID=UPI000FD9FB36|nr:MULTISPECIES: ABC transporter permease [unclassified Devosia]